MTSLFWFAFFALAYIYIVYPLLVWVLASAVGRPPRKADVTPSVVLLIPAYNEEPHIEAKLRNSLELDYPRDRLQIVVANDGSTDRTEALARPFEAQGVRILTMPQN